MDVTPHELRSVELPEAWRGYRQEAVDDLLDGAAGTIERLQAQVDRLGERLTRAEEEAGVGREGDEMLRRTLLLAQRTADAAVSEAQERARRVLSESEARATSILSTAEQEARQLVATERRRLEEEIRDLARRRDHLLTDVEALERRAGDYRRRLKSFLETELASLDTRTPPVAPPVPTLAVQPESGLGSEDELVAEAGTEASTDSDAGIALDDPPEALTAVDAEISTGEWPAATLDDGAEDPEPNAAEDVPAEASEATATNGPQAWAPPPAVDLPAMEDDDVPAPAATEGRSEADEDADLLPRRRGRRDREPVDDEFFEDLRRAVQDGTPLGPRDDDVEAPEEAWDTYASDEAMLYDQDAEDEPRRLRTMFRRRD